MHPQIQRPEPGLCPLCGMDLIRATDGGALTPQQVALSPRAAALAKVRTSPVVALDEEDGSGRAMMTLSGRVAVDETSLRAVTAWTGGRIESLTIASTGQTIKRGQVVAQLYSPEVYAAHRDLLAAAAQVEALAQAEPATLRSAQRALEGSRQRLRLLGVSDDELGRMLKSDAPWTRAPVRSASSGTVMERLVSQGDYVQPGQPLYKIAALDEVWVQLDAYEAQLGRLRVGQPARVSVSARPEESFEGSIAFIDPVLNPQSRTAQVRVVVKNGDRRLKPGMTARALLDAPASAPGQPLRLSIPRSAPLLTGKRAVVYVVVPDQQRPTYEAREVALGPLIGDRYVVRAGLSREDRVVTHGAFTLDADLQLRGGDSMMTRPDDDTTTQPTIIEVDDTFRAGFAPVLEAYLGASEALARDDLSAAKAAATTLVSAARAFDPTQPVAAQARWASLAPALIASAAQLESASQLEQARGAFLGASQAVIALLASVGNPLSQPLRLAHCPMAFGDRGAQWVQRGEVIDNAYFGESMRKCGEFRAVVEPGAALGATGGAP